MCWQEVLLGFRECASSRLPGLLGAAAGLFPARVRRSTGRLCCEFGRVLAGVERPSVVHVADRAEPHLYPVRTLCGVEVDASRWVDRESVWVEVGEFPDGALVCPGCQQAL